MHRSTARSVDGRKKGPARIGSDEKLCLRLDVIVPVVVMLRTDVITLYVPSAVRLAGLNVLVDPAGRPVQVRVIVPVKPLGELG